MRVLLCGTLFNYGNLVADERISVVLIQLFLLLLNPLLGVPVSLRYEHRSNGYPQEQTLFGSKAQSLVHCVPDHLMH
jgi:hypothetical protein